MNSILSGIKYIETILDREIVWSVELVEDDLVLSLITSTNSSDVEKLYKHELLLDTDLNEYHSISRRKINIPTLQNENDISFSYEDIDGIDSGWLAIHLENSNINDKNIQTDEIVKYITEQYNIDDIITVDS